MERLGDLFTLIGGGTPTTSNNEYWGYGTPWISSADIDNKGIIISRRNVTNLGVENSTTNVVSKGTVVVVTRVGLGKVAQLPCDMCFSQDIQALVPKHDDYSYSAEYLKYQLAYIMQTLKYHGQGTTISGITKKQLADVMLYMPSVDMQKHIVNRIEELFSQLDAGVETLKKTKAQLAVYRQAVLKEAFDSATVDCQMLPIEGLLSKERKGMTTGPFGTIIKKADHKSSGVPMLGIENIGNGEFRDGNKIYVTVEKAKELKPFEVQENDIIISRSGTVGEICTVPKRAKGSLLSTNLMRIALDESVIRSDYFIHLFRSKGIVLDQVKELCKGSTRAFLNQTILKQIIFPVPSLDCQGNVVKIITARLSVCENIEQTINTTLQQAAALRQSILKQAFGGII